MSISHTYCSTASVRFVDEKAPSCSVRLQPVTVHGRLVSAAPAASLQTTTAAPAASLRTTTAAPAASLRTANVLPGRAGRGCSRAPAPR